MSLKLKNEILSEENEILELSQSISDLKEIFQDMHTLMVEDEEIINKIETTTDEAENNTNRGVISLFKAANISHAVTIPITLAVAGTLFGPGAMVLLGIKSAIAVSSISAGGALAGGIFGKQVHTLTKSSKDGKYK